MGSSIDAALAFANEARANSAENATGHIASTTPGRTDQEMLSVQDGSYIIPADIVSSFGEGNSEAGAALLDRIFPDEPEQFAAVGAPQLIDIAAAGGEYVVPASAVRKLGGGDLERGHRILDSMVKQQRAATVKTLKSLPGPKK